MLFRHVAFFFSNDENLILPRLVHRLFVSSPLALLAMALTDTSKVTLGQPDITAAKGCLFTKGFSLGMGRA